MRISVIRHGQFVELTEAQQDIVDSLQNAVDTASRKKERQIETKVEAKPFTFRRGQRFRLPVFREWKP